jgi:hypothetical protein
MQWDDHTLVFINRRFHVETVRLDCSLAAAAAMSAPEQPKFRIIKTTNPLEQNIIALLRGRPTISRRRTLQAQRFLERLFGGNG